jgi:hypothetical protein
MTMQTIRFSLAVILTIYSIPTLLSGLDIYKGTEPDLSSEWTIVCIFFVLMEKSVILTPQIGHVDPPKVLFERTDGN